MCIRDSTGVLEKTALAFGQMNEPPGARMRVASVSYTHLDVYKRQALWSVGHLAGCAGAALFLLFAGAAVILSLIHI